LKGYWDEDEYAAKINFGSRDFIGGYFFDVVRLRRRHDDKGA
jgi:hypothetical protein